MIYDNSQPVFPNWWDALDSADSPAEDDGHPEGGEASPVGAPCPSSLRGPGDRYGSDGPEPPRAWPDPDRLDREDWGGLSVEEQSEGFGGAADRCAGWRRGYSRDLVDTVWEFGMTVAGNDPELWRKDEFGNWIHRFAYGQRGSRFGWEIFDPGVGRHHRGVRAMRPMQWEGYLRYCETLT